MESPQALGARSSCRPPRPGMQVKMNLKSSTRVLSPIRSVGSQGSCLAYFNIRHDNAYMLIVSQLADSTKLTGR